MRAPAVITVAALCLSLASLGLTACSGPEEPEPLPEQYLFGGDRPAELLIPASYDHTEPAPLLVVLHGYSASGFLQLAYTGLRNLTDLGYLVIGPEGTVDSGGNQFWNAHHACCDFDDSMVDDVSYITDLIAEVQSVYLVDSRRIYLFGHSNGGFMSYRMACERADTIAAIVSLAGATDLDPAECAPSEPVSVLQIHGDADDTILYEDTQGYPGAVRSVQQWSDYNGCTGTLQADAARLDLDSGLDGTDTRVERHGDCPAGIAADLWTIEQGAHLPRLQLDFAQQVAGWLDAHAKPTTM